MQFAKRFLPKYRRNTDCRHVLMIQIFFRLPYYRQLEKYRAYTPAAFSSSSAVKNTQRVARQGAVAGEQAAVFVDAAVDAGFTVFHHYAQLFQAFGEQPRQFARHIADVQIRAFVQSVGEHAQLVAFKREFVIWTTYGCGSQHGGVVAQGDDEFVGRGFQAAC